MNLSIEGISYLIRFNYGKYLKPKGMLCNVKEYEGKYSV